VRRKLQRIGVGHILFLDETLKREGDVDSHSIFLPGEPPYIESSTTSSYAARYDMIACCSGKTVLLPVIYSPKERQRGIDTAMLLEHIRQLLAQAAGALDQYPLLLVLDRASIHHEDKILQEFHDWGLSGADGGDQDATCGSQAPLSARQFPLQPLAAARSG
jgi:hypothetical protein